MIRLYTKFTVALLLLGLSACSTSTPVGSAVPVAGSSAPALGQCGNDFYPIVKGASWSYKVTGGTTAQFTRSIADVHPTSFTDQDAFSDGTVHVRNWKCDDEALIAMQPDEGATGSIQFYSRIDKYQTTQVDGVTITDQFIPGANWNQVLLLEGTSDQNGQDIPAKDAVTLECSAGNTETISVPAGVFQAIRGNCRSEEKLTLTVNGANQQRDIVTTCTVWYATGVGLIKSEQSVGSGPKTTTELVSYKVP